ncbi:hypothetical protein PSYAE_23718 [Pseudomonas amygdali pv. aesculi str. 0893_23]|nr:DUF932 domain-containing protein [Pseudomonas amygdali]EGH04908.1 hypothetical protein PSYAE_23718 [Pseudomonas amygdali pv. aesculi str. 0893_23]KPW08454.1 hypothetical protein ALO90_200124 [Pseudomonas amygdali pv. aesculi]
MRMSSNFRNPCMIRSDVALSNDQIAHYVPSIFAEEAHDSRSARYLYIPTVQVLDALRAEGFEPFMACQTRVRDQGKREHTKHMLRLRHASQILDQEANEIILLNSHDGSSSYQMIGGKFRFVCANGLVLGDLAADQKVRHSGRGDVVNDVIEGAFEVLKHFEQIDHITADMKHQQLDQDEQEAFALAALAYRYDPADSSPDMIYPGTPHPNGGEHHGPLYRNLDHVQRKPRRPQGSRPRSSGAIFSRTDCSRRARYGLYVRCNKQQRRIETNRPSSALADEKCRK